MVSQLKNEFGVSSIVEVSSWINVHVDDWVGESTIIASNENFSVKLRSVWGEGEHHWKTINLRMTSVT